MINFYEKMILVIFSIFFYLSALSTSAQVFMLQDQATGKYLSFIEKMNISLDHASESSEFQLYWAFAGTNGSAPLIYIKNLSAKSNDQNFLSADKNSTSIELEKLAKGWQEFRLLSSGDDYIVKTRNDTFIGLKGDGPQLEQVKTADAATKFAIVPKVYDNSDVSFFINENGVKRHYFANFLLEIKYLMFFDKNGKIKYLDISNRGKPSLSDRSSRMPISLISSVTPQAYFIKNSWDNNYLSADKNSDKLNVVGHNKDWEEFKFVSNGRGGMYLQTKHGSYIQVIKDKLTQTKDIKDATSFEGLFGYENDKYFDSEIFKSIRHEFRKDAKVISIGWNCAARYHIENDYYKTGFATQFCDRVFSEDFSVILGILKLGTHKSGFLKAYDELVGSEDDMKYKKAKVERIDKKVIINNLIEIDFNEINNGHAKLTLKKLPKFASVHDVEIGAIDLDDKGLLEHVEKEFRSKYQRRLERLISDIKGKDKIYFLRWSYNKDPISDLQVADFFNVLEEISPNNKHVLVNAGIKDSVTKKNIDRFKYFDLRKYPMLKPGYSLWYRQDQFDFKPVFEWIEK